MTYVDTTNLNKKVAVFLDSVGKLIEEEAKVRVPVVSGKLRASIYSSVEGNRVKIGTQGVSYASFVEYGTGVMVRAHGEHDPENPVIDWEALEKRGEFGLGKTMPFLRAAAFAKENEIKKLAKEVL